ncbi:TPA: transposase family protein [Xanthomonas vasicola pv. zeae]|nr:transposase family protein [Xanthomonas vasicola pv. zeae]HHZ31013.1 transposase family protein [Xanthomonas vasicola pv. zeae]HHZ34478.1 transposase family protein [Xanthomonas vasicola pv. zeae]HHZ39410.1 transposase family protein [Xanthomonas vasicola pv. zeae]HHZ42896.1 transposase family protein [Xanthomonas vasicola pv. zeae]
MEVGQRHQGMSGHRSGSEPQSRRPRGSDGTLTPPTHPAAAHPDDNGSEFISMVMDRWAYDNGMTMDYSRPGNPTDNPFIESFNGSFRDECTTSIAQRPMLPMSR